MTDRATLRIAVWCFIAMVAFGGGFFAGRAYGFAEMSVRCACEPLP